MQIYPYPHELMCMNLEIDCKSQINAMATSVTELDLDYFCAVMHLVFIPLVLKFGTVQ